MYHTTQGTNRFIGVPAKAAVLIQAALEVLFNTWHAYEAVAALEKRALSRLLEAGQLQYTELSAGETLLILPRAGHTVLAGPFGKTVLAAEWHALHQ